MTPNLTKLAESLEWQPIADAPRDGSQMLLSTPEYGGKQIIDWIAFDGTLGRWSDVHSVSHFMPLPTGQAGGIIRVLAEALERMRNENSDPYGIAKYALQRAEQLAGGGE